MQNYLHISCILPAIRAGILVPNKFQSLVSSFIVVNEKFIKYLTECKLHDIIEILLKAKPELKQFYAQYAIKFADLDTIKHAHKICGEIKSNKYKQIVKEGKIDILQYLLDIGHNFVKDHIKVWAFYYENEAILDWIKKNIDEDLMPADVMVLPNRLTKRKGMWRWVRGSNKFHGGVDIVENLNDWQYINMWILSCATNANNLPVVKYILEKSTEYMTAQVQIKKSNWECLKLLDERGQDIVHHAACYYKLNKGVAGNVPLWFKIKMGNNVRLLDYFIKRGSLVDIMLFDKTLINENHLNLAIVLNYVDVVKYIVNKCKINTERTVFGYWPSPENSKLGVVDKRKREMIMKLLK